MRKHSGVIGPLLSPVRRAFDVGKTGKAKATQARIVQSTIRS